MSSEEDKQRSRDWYKNNKERASKRGKEYYQKKREERLQYARDYYLKNKVKASQTNRQYYIKNKTKLNKQNIDRYYKNREKYLDQKREQHQRDYPKARIAALTYYGKGKLACVCCGETRIKFLTIDHKNNDGHEHRKNKATVLIAYWLKRKQYPEGFQTLCFNCNSGRALNGGICPHQEEQIITKRSMKPFHFHAIGVV